MAAKIGSSINGTLHRFALARRQCRRLPSGGMHPGSKGWKETTQSIRHIRTYRKNAASRWYGHSNLMNVDADPANAICDSAGLPGGFQGLVRPLPNQLATDNKLQRFGFDIAQVSPCKSSLLTATSEYDAYLCQGSLIVPPCRQPDDRMRRKNVLLVFANVAASLDNLWDVFSCLSNIEDCQPETTLMV